MTIRLCGMSKERHTFGENCPNLAIVLNVCMTAAKMTCFSPGLGDRAKRTKRPITKQCPPK